MNSLPARERHAIEVLLTTFALTAIIAARYLVASGLAYWLLWQRGGEKLRARRLNRDRRCDG